MKKLFEWLDSATAYKYLTAILLLTIPLYLKFPIFSIPGSYVAIRIEDFLLSIGAVIVFLSFIRTDKSSFFKDRFNQAIMLFLAAGLISVLSGTFVTHTISPSVGILHWARRIEYILPFFIGLNAIRRGVNLQYFIQLICLVVFCAFIYGWGQMHFNFPVITTQNEEYSKGIALRWVPGARLPSTFAGHYDLAGYLLLVFPILIGYLFTFKKHIHRALLFSFALIPGYWLFLQTEARVSFVAYIIVITLMLFQLGKKKFILPFIVLSIIGSIFLSDIGSRYADTINVYKNKIIGEQSLIIKTAYAESSSLPARGESSAPAEDRSTAIRLNVEWPRAIRAFTKNPLLGTGYSSITLATDNDYLRLLGEVGLVGALAFLLIFVRMSVVFKPFIMKVVKMDIEQLFVSGFIFGALGILLNATFIDMFEASKVAITFWLLAGIAVGIVGKKHV
jgi:hypothetical protein